MLKEGDRLIGVREGQNASEMTAITAVVRKQIVTAPSGNAYTYSILYSFCRQAECMDGNTPQGTPKRAKRTARTATKPVPTSLPPIGADPVSTPPGSSTTPGPCRGCWDY